MAFLFIQSSLHAQLWSNDITGSNASATNPYTSGDVTSPNITVSGISYGAGLTAVSSTDQFKVSGFTPISPSPTSNDYLEFTLTPQQGYSITIDNINMSVERGSGGPSKLRLAASYTNYDYSNPIYSANTPSAPIEDEEDETDISIPINNSFTTAVTFRLYAFSAGNSAGTLSVNNFAFIGSVNQIPLPLNLLSFDAKKQQGLSVLNWHCSNQKNISRFEIERSNDGNTFKSAGVVKAQNIVEEIAYNFKESLPEQETTFYRLKIHETNGSVTYSKIVSLKAVSENNVKTYPNPFTDKLTLNGITESSNIQVSDIYGKVIWQKNDTNSTIDIDSHSWSNGIYMIRINNNYLTKIVKK